MGVPMRDYFDIVCNSCIETGASRWLSLMFGYEKTKKEIDRIGGIKNKVTSKIQTRT